MMLNKKAARIIVGQICACYEAGDDDDTLAEYLIELVDAGVTDSMIELQRLAREEWPATRP